MLGLSTTGALLATPPIVCVGGPGKAGSGSVNASCLSIFISFPEPLI